jgi:hypothetical protein
MAMRADFRLLRTQAFRIVLIYVVLFALSVGALLFFTYWNTRRTLDEQNDQIIAAEITGLSEQYQRLGLRGLAETIISRSQHAGLSFYILADQDHHILAGNLDSWPTIHDTGGFVEFDYERRIGGAAGSVPEVRRARGKLFPLQDNLQLLVAQDVHDRDLTQRMFTTTLPSTVALILVMGLAMSANCTSRWRKKNMSP